MESCITVSSIKKVGNDDYTIGYSSYNLDFVLEWKEKYFELIKKSRLGTVKYWVIS